MVTLLAVFVVAAIFTICIEWMLEEADYKASQKTLEMKRYGILSKMIEEQEARKTESNERKYDSLEGLELGPEFSVLPSESPEGCWYCGRKCYDEGYSTCPIVYCSTTDSLSDNSHLNISLTLPGSAVILDD